MYVCINTYLCICVFMYSFFLKMVANYAYCSMLFLLYLIYLGAYSLSIYKEFILSLSLSLFLLQLPIVFHSRDVS